MRINFISLPLAAVLSIGLSSAVSLAQDQNQQPEANSAPSTASQSDSMTGKPHHAPNPQRQAKKLAKKLGLTADQQAQIEPVLADRLQQVQSVRADTTLAPKDRMAKLRGIRQDTDSRIEAILNDTQKQQYEQMKQEMRARRQQHMQQQTSAPSNS